MTRALRLTRSELARSLARNGDMRAAFDQIALGPHSPLTQATKARRGSAAVAQGKSFQDAIRESLDVEVQRGACIWGEGNPRVQGAPRHMYPVAPATVDFHLLAHNVPIAFDCKTIHGNEGYDLHYIGDAKEVERHRRQVRWLADFRRHGGIAFLLLYERKLDRAWLLFQLQTLLNDGNVAVRSHVRAARGISANVVDHLPVITPRQLVPTWGILEAALTYGRKTLPLDSPWRDQ